MKEVLQKLIAHQKLSGEEAREALLKLASGEVNHSQAAAFLTVYLMRNISVEELGGFREAMLELCVKTDLTDFDPIDVCGTGGDGKNTFNISTTTSFVLAAAGISVAKHGNNGVSSICGSSNVMAHLGYNFTNDLEQLKREMDAANICFLHAPFFHPAMKEVAPIRKELGMKTFFNMLGPLVNPTRPKKQLIGVFDLELARRYQYLLQEDMDRFTVVHSLDGYDEVSLTGPFKVIDKEGENIVFPEDMEFKKLNANAIKGGETVEESVDMLVNILKGHGTEAQNQVVIANSALGITTAKDQSISQSRDEAREILESGKAYTSLKKLIDTSNKN